MKSKKLNSDRYYITEVDVLPTSIYCYHDVMGEYLIPDHSHQKAQLIYTEGGIVHIHTENNIYYIPPRHFMWIPAGIKHSIHSNTEKSIMRNLYFPVNAKDNAFYQTEGIYLVDDLLLHLILYTDKWRGNVLVEDKNYAVPLAIKAILPDVCKQAVPLSLTFPKNARLKKIVSFMADHLEEQLSYAELAKKYGFSERTLNRLFKRETGMSFIRYFTIQKMLKAIELLMANEMTVKEVAFAVGYNSTPTFSNTFFKLLGQRPSEFLLKSIPQESL